MDFSRYFEMWKCLCWPMETEAAPPLTCVGKSQWKCFCHQNYLILKATWIQEWSQNRDTCAFLRMDLSFLIWSNEEVIRGAPWCKWGIAVTCLYSSCMTNKLLNAVSGVKLSSVFISKSKGEFCTARGNSFKREGFQLITLVHISSNRSRNNLFSKQCSILTSCYQPVILPKVRGIPINNISHSEGRDFLVRVRKQPHFINGVSKL